MSDSYADAVNRLNRAFDKFKRGIGKALCIPLFGRSTIMYYRRYARHGKKH